MAEALDGTATAVAVAVAASHIQRIVGYQPEHIHQRHSLEGGQVPANFRPHALPQDEKKHDESSII